MVRKAQIKDIEKIICIHIERFSNFFLTSLGVGFLKIFYTAFLKEPGVILVIEDEGEIKGFAAGNRNHRGFFRKMLKNNFWNFILVGVKIFLTNPFALMRILFNLKRSEKQSIDFAELLSIATVKNNKGYGKILLQKFEDEIQKKVGKIPISLTTDYADNEKAVQFYKDSGYEVLEVFYSYKGRKMYRFIKNN